jgi:hypothetical protein
MPDMTKQDPQPGSGDTAVAEPDTACPDCGHDHTQDPKQLVPGSRSWFWAKRVENLALFLGPAIPLGIGVTQLIRPSVTVSLTDKQQAAIDGVYNMPGTDASVSRVIVLMDHPGFWDRLVAAGPALLLGLLLALLSYALWRIEINLSANGKYTDKDTTVLSSASRWLWHGWWFLIAAELTVTWWFRDAPASEHWWIASATTPFGNASLIALVVAGFMGVVARIYRNGAKAYAELERAV